MSHHQAELEFAAIAQGHPVAEPAFKQLWGHVERLLAALTPTGKLLFGGSAFLLIAQAISERADLLLVPDALSDLFHDEALDYLLPGVSALDGFVGGSGTGFRSSSLLDDSLLLEPERQEGGRESKPSSQVQLELDVAVTEKLFSKEDIPQWQSAVKACLGSSAGQQLSLFELGNLCGLSPVETFLALLHSTAAGETALMESDGDFYRQPGELVAIAGEVERDRCLGDGVIGDF